MLVGCGRSNPPVDETIMLAMDRRSHTKEQAAGPKRKNRIDWVKNKGRRNTRRGREKRENKTQHSRKTTHILHTPKHPRILGTPHPPAVILHRHVRQPRSIVQSLEMLEDMPSARDATKLRGAAGWAHYGDTHFALTDRRGG